MEHGYIHIADNIFPTLLAISTEEQSKGLMYQEWPPPVMSFLYSHARVVKFWMKNTPSPLDIVFCHQGKVTQIRYGEPHSTRMIGGDVFSDLVVEFPYGTVLSSGIKINHFMGLVSPSPAELQKIFAEKCLGIAKF
jgi:uncharacterized protein